MRLTLTLPKEFVALCVRDSVAPSEVLRGFVADLCALRDHAGQYVTNGSDERMLAQQYYDRVGYPYWNAP